MNNTAHTLDTNWIRIHEHYAQMRRILEYKKQVLYPNDKFYGIYSETEINKMVNPEFDYHWMPLCAYNENDKVKHNGRVWKSTANNNTTEPTRDGIDDWQLISYVVICNPRDLVAIRGIIANHEFGGAEADANLIPNEWRKTIPGSEVGDFATSKYLMIFHVNLEWTKLAATTGQGDFPAWEGGNNHTRGEVVKYIDNLYFCYDDITTSNDPSTETDHWILIGAAIDYNNGWVPIGIFTGTFDGAGHIVYGSYIMSTTSNVGIISSSSNRNVIVKNVAILNVFHLGQHRVATWVGNSSSNVEGTTLSYNNIIGSGVIVATASTPGGIVAQLWSRSVMKDCYSTVRGARSYGGTTSGVIAENVYHDSDVSGLGTWGANISKTTAQMLALGRPWQTLTTYVAGDLVSHNDIWYVTTAHTSGVFADDVTAGKLTATTWAPNFKYKDNMYPYFIELPCHYGPVRETIATIAEDENKLTVTWTHPTGWAAPMYYRAYSIHTDPDNNIDYKMLKEVEVTGADITTMEIPVTDLPIGEHKIRISAVHGTTVKEIPFMETTGSAISDVISNQMFVMKVRTTTAEEDFRLPLTADAGYDFFVDWGDGTDVEALNDTDKVTSNGLDNCIPHTYSSTGDHVIKILPKTINNFPRIHFNNAADKDKLLDIMHWGTNKWTSMQNAFWGCSNLGRYTAIQPSITASDIPDVSIVTSLESMLRSCGYFNGNMHNWDVLNVSSMAIFAYLAIRFSQNLGSWKLRPAGVNMAVALQQSSTGVYSPENYAKTLIGWANYVKNTDNGAKAANTPLNVTLGAGNVAHDNETYTEAEVYGAVRPDPFTITNALKAKLYLTAPTSAPAWVAGVYSIGDYVTHNDKIYKCILETTTEEPGVDTAYWEGTPYSEVGAGWTINDDSELPEVMAFDNNGDYIEPIMHDGKEYHIFKTPGENNELITAASVLTDYLLVAGGGIGGSASSTLFGAGGGGAGGLISQTNVEIPVNIHNVVIGDGSDNTIFNSQTAIYGGKGGNQNEPGSDGGSGGGAGSATTHNVSTISGGDPIPNDGGTPPIGEQGHRGGDRPGETDGRGGASGGGFASAGIDASGINGQNGGAGINLDDIWTDLTGLTFTAVGTSNRQTIDQLSNIPRGYAGGGASGGRNAAVSGIGTHGGGGERDGYETGQENSGGGGRGAAGENDGLVGGSGILIVRRKDYAPETIAYITRVNADTPSEVKDSDSVDNDIRFLKGESIDGYQLSKSYWGDVGFMMTKDSGRKTAFRDIAAPGDPEELREFVTHMHNVKQMPTTAGQEENWDVRQEADTAQPYINAAGDIETSGEANKLLEFFEGASGECGLDIVRNIPGVTTVAITRPKGTIYYMPAIGSTNITTAWAYGYSFPNVNGATIANRIGHSSPRNTNHTNTVDNIPDALLVKSLVCDYVNKKQFVRVARPDLDTENEFDVVDAAWGGNTDDTRSGGAAIMRTSTAASETRMAIIFRTADFGVDRADLIIIENYFKAKYEVS